MYFLPDTIWRNGQSLNGESGIISRITDKAFKGSNAYRRALEISSAMLLSATQSARETCFLLGSYSQGLRMRTRPAATASKRPAEGF